MKTLVTAILVCLALLALHGCARNFRSELGEAGLVRLRAESEQLWNKYANPDLKSKRGVVLPQDSWPATIAAIAPEQVHVRTDGVYVFVASGYLNSQILYVPCPQCPSLSLEGTQAHMREIGPRVYDLNAGQ